MKNVKVRYTYLKEGREVEGIMVESHSDLLPVMEYLDGCAKNVAAKYMKSDLPFDNHFTGSLQKHEYSIAVMASVKAYTNNVNPLWNLGGAVAAKVNTIRKILDMGYPVFMNPSGGVCRIDGQLIVLLEQSEFSDFPSNRMKPVMGSGEKVINLENDPYIEKEAKRYMQNRWGNYSLIRELRAYSKSDLVGLFKGFIGKGGETVYVYTTGRDVTQMYEYSEAALQAGLKHFVFDFNCGHTEAIKEFLNWLNELATVEDLTK